jgi:hypothetical protein
MAAYIVASVEPGPPSALPSRFYSPSLVKCVVNLKLREKNGYSVDVIFGVARAERQNFEGNCSS